MGRAHGPLTPASPLRLGKNISKGKRAYFGCLLFVREWFDQGLRELPRSAPITFFQLMLAARSPVERNSIPLGLRSPYYQRAIEQLNRGDSQLVFNSIEGEV